METQTGTRNGPATKAFVRFFNPVAVHDLEQLIDELLACVDDAGYSPASHSVDFGELSITVVVVALQR